MKPQVAATGVAITGAGRIKYYDTTLPPAPDPEHVVGGLYAVPLKTSANSFPDGDYLFPSEFEIAAKDIGLSGAYGRPTFGALAKAMIESTPYEDTLRYAFVTQPFKPRCDWVLGTKESFEIVTRAMDGERINELTPKRLEVARAVLGLIDDNDIEALQRKVNGIDRHVELICQDLENDGFAVQVIHCTEKELLRGLGADKTKGYLVFSGEYLVSWEGSREYKHVRPGQQFECNPDSARTVLALTEGILIEFSQTDAGADRQ